MNASSYTHAAKELVLLQRHGALSTLSRSEEGYPFGSLAPYDIDESGRVIIYISRIAEHFRNLEHDPRASLLVTEPFMRGDPLQHARATMILDFTTVPAEEAPVVQRRYEERFPGSVQYELAHNFVFLRGAVRRIRWIGGFGEIGWVSEDSFRTAPWDSIAYGGYPIIQHMMDDHVDALRDLVRARTGKVPDAANVVMQTVSSHGFAVKVYDRDGRSVIERFRFPEPCSTSDEVRRAVVMLLKDARLRIVDSV